MRKVCSSVMAVLVFLIIVAFFMPWVGIESTQAAGKLSEILTGEERRVSQTVSAYQVPRLANTKDTRLAISVIKIMNPGVKDADKKSFLVWVVPLLAVTILALSILFKNNKWLHLACALIGILIFSIGVYRIKSANLSQALLNIAIGPGLWLTLWAYLGLGLCELLNFSKSVTANKK